MRIVVTGSSGRLGMFVVRELLAQHYDVVPVDRRAHNDPAMPATQVVDLAQPGDYGAFFRDVQVVCHLGNLPSFDPRLTAGMTPAKGFAENVASTYAVFDAAVDMGVRHFVYASSVNAYGVCLMSPDKPQLVSPPRCHVAAETAPGIRQPDGLYSRYRRGPRRADVLPAAAAGTHAVEYLRPARRRAMGPADDPGQLRRDSGNA